jgi:hypothetical protein
MESSKYEKKENLFLRLILSTMRTELGEHVYQLVLFSCQFYHFYNVKERRGET